MAFKRLNPQVDTLSQFLSQIPTLVNNFIQADLRAKELAADRLERKENREEDIQRREKWREEDLVAEENKFERNQSLQYKLGMKKDLLAILDSKQKEYETYITNWENIGLEVDDQIKYNQTNAFKDMISTAPTKVLKQVSKDIKTLNGLVNDIDAKIIEMKGRNSFINNVRFEVQKHSDGYKYVSGTKEELEADMVLWTTDDFEVVVSNIMSDPDFLEENKDHLSQPYATEYMDKLRSPASDKLRELNEGIFTHEAKKFEASTRIIENKLKKIVFDAKSDPSIIQAQFISEQINSLDIFEQGLDHLPGFKTSENKLLVAHDQYAIDVGSIANKLSTTESIDEYYEEATAIGYIVKNSKNKERWNRATAEQYLKWKAGVEFSKSSGLALVLGPHRVKEIFAQDKKSNSQLLNHLARLIVDVDNYTSADDKTKRMIENQWGIRIGTATSLSNDDNVQHLLEDLKTTLSSLLGTEDVDMKDTEFMMNYGRIKKAEKRIREMQSYAPEDFKNFKSTLSNRSMFNTDNELELEVLSTSVSCGPGQTFHDGTGMCFYDSDLPSIVALGNTPSNKGAVGYTGSKDNTFKSHDGLGNILYLDQDSKEFKTIKKARENNNKKADQTTGGVKVNVLTGHIEARY